MVGAYGFDPSLDVEAPLLDLDLDLAGREERGESIRGPGPDGLPNTRVTDRVLAAPDLDDVS